MDITSNLQAIGFTEYEARVYLALLEQHPATGYQLSRDAGIPRSMVYEALGRLETRGAVLSSVDKRATHYRPVPPDTLLDRFAKEHSIRIDKLRRGLNRAFEPRDEDRLWTIEGSGAVLAFAGGMLKHAENEIFLVADDPALAALFPHLQDSLQQKVSTNLLLTGPGELSGRPGAENFVNHPALQVARHPPRESEIHELTDMLLLAVDGESCLIASPDSRTGELQGTVTSNRNLVLVASQFVWMELFTQRLYTNIGEDLLDRLSPQDRQIFEDFTPFLPESSAGERNT
jgi:Cd2+/Zn2+-exporting ATPase